MGGMVDMEHFSCCCVPFESCYVQLFLERISQCDVPFSPERSGFS
jgi:hypothetical protein